MSKRILVTTWCTDDYSNFLGVSNLLNSFKHFHPNIDFRIFDSEMTSKANQNHNWLKPTWMIPPSCIPFVDDYDMIVHMDADSIVTGPMNELFDNNSDVIGVRNNNTLGNAGANGGITIRRMPPYGNGEFISIQNFINAGLVAVNKKDFWYEWNELNRNSSQSQSYGFCDEQDTLNQLFHSGKYTTEIIDSIGNGVSYGVSNTWGEDSNHWKSWSDLYVEDDALYLNDLVSNHRMCVKVLHQAGGGVAYDLNKKYGTFQNWLKSVLSKDSLEYIQNISKNKNL